MLIFKTKDFSLEQTLECGQVFRFRKIKDNEYFLCTQDKVARLRQENNNLIIENNFENEDFWRNYFDLDTDYKTIKKQLYKNKELVEAIKFGQGIHILEQDYKEIIISFIMSQNKQIPQIKQCIELYCQKFGEKIIFQNEEFFTFPKLTVLPTKEELKECKVGFRDKYILDALQKEIEGYFENLENLTAKEQEEKLLKVQGIGPKVCNCILLFGLNQTNRFPIDVWIKKKMQEIYFEGKETDNSKIETKANELFGEYKGYAQQYLFFAGINGKI